MNTGERFNAMLDDLRLSKNAFAKNLGVSSTAINGIVSNLHSPGQKILSAIKNRYPQYSVDWLVAGKGEMRSSEVEVLNASKDYLQDYLIRLEDQFKLATEQSKVLAEQSKVLAEHLQSQLAVKDRQIEKLMELLGKLDLSENEPCENIRPLHLKPAA